MPTLTFEVLVVFSISLEFNRNYGTVFVNVFNPLFVHKLFNVSASCFWSAF